MVTIQPRFVSRVLIQGESTTVVHAKPSGNVVRVVQSASPLLMQDGSIYDPGDLVPRFESALI